MTNNPVDLFEKKTTRTGDLMVPARAPSGLIPGVKDELASKVIKALGELSPNQLAELAKDPNLALFKQEKSKEIEAWIYVRDAMLKLCSSKMFMRWSKDQDYAEITYEAAKAMGGLANCNIYQSSDVVLDPFVDKDGIKHYNVRVKVKGERGFPKLYTRIEQMVYALLDNVPDLHRLTAELILRDIKGVIMSKVIEREFEGTVSTNKDFYLKYDKGTWSKTANGGKGGYINPKYYKDGDDVMANRGTDLEKHALSQAAKKVFGALFGMGTIARKTLEENGIVWEECSKGYSEGWGRGASSSDKPNNPQGSSVSSGDFKPATDKQQLAIFKMTIGDDKSIGAISGAEEHKKEVEDLIYKSKLSIGGASDMIKYMKEEQKKEGPIEFDAWKKKFESLIEQKEKKE